MTENSQSSLMIFKRFLSEAFVHRRLLAVILLAIIGSTISTLAAPYILRIAIDEYIVPGRFEDLAGIALLYLIALTGQWLFTTLQTYTVQVFGQRVLFDLRARLQRKLLDSKLDYFKDKRTGDLVSRIINDTSMVNDVLVSGLLGGIGSLLSLVGIIGAMLLLDVQLTVVAMTTIPLMVFISKYFGGRIYRAYRDTRQKIAKISSIVEESVSGIETVKAFGREPMVEEEFSRASRDTVKAYMRVAYYMGFFWPLMNISSLLSIVIVLAYGSYLAYTGAVSLGIVVAFVQYTQRFRGPINNVVSMYDSLQSALASLVRIYEVLDDENTEETEGEKIDRLKGEIELREVWFEYEPENPVLKNVNLHIKPGETIALVGRTGAGKTTLANLIMRFYDPTKGLLLYDGKDSRQLDRRSIRARIGYVPQETYLFPGTIAENIQIARPGASLNDVVRVCKELGIHEFIIKLPRGYDTPAGEAGKLLSVGEKQLISLARALIRDPDIVILDEALSSVDPRTEQLVYQAMQKLMNGRTSIIIAHRLSLTRLADRIIVLDQGKIIEQGSFNDLIKKKGYFYKLYTSQFEKTMSKPLTYKAVSPTHRKID
ncbi:MAG: ABC transporter ATP-binding protein/permease [Desulfurococcales archaeon]|nr:ABC transporter ATP-binding protein/permease [Desulfurococcales archaeon]